MGRLRATYRDGFVIEREGTASFGLLLPAPRNRPILIELWEAPLEHIKHARMKVDIQSGRVICIYEK